MSAGMLGQLSALDLLTSEAQATPLAVSPWATCIACGEEEIHSWIMPHESKELGHPVCVGMSLTLNHIAYAMRQTARTGDNNEPVTCCFDKNGIHGKSIRKPTRDQWLDHANAYILRAKTKWALHMPSLIAAVGELRVQCGINPVEAPVIELPEFSIHSGRHPGMQSPCGYCGKVVGSGSGNGGGCGRLPDDRWCVWRICADCLNTHGPVDISIHPNLKVLP